MTAAPTADALAAALAAAGAAHHDYESRFLGGTRDEAWPGWYAAYVLGRVGDFVPASDLSDWLRDAPSGDDWTHSAAAYVLQRLLES